MAITALLLFNAPTTLPESKVRPPRKVSIIKVQSSDHRISVGAHGTVIPVRTVDIEPQVTGPIISHHPSLVPGGVLEEGESLFVIDGTLTQLELQEARASVNRAKAMLAESKRKQRQAQQLANERVIADTELAAIESLVQIQTAELQRLNAGRDRIRELLDRHVVHAPFNALVLMESVEIGQQVDPGFVAAYFDTGGRYAFGRQPEASLWAVCRLADCLVPFCAASLLEGALQDFYATLETGLRRRLCWRLGIQLDDEASVELSTSLFAAAKATDTGFAQIFHDWYGGTPRRGDYNSTEWQTFAGVLAGAKPLASADHPFFDRDKAIALPIETVEALFDPIAAHDDWAPLYAFVDDIREMGAALSS